MWRSRARSRTKGTSRSLGALRGVQWTFSIEGFHNAVRTPCVLRADAMLDIFFCAVRYRKNPEKITEYALISYLFYLSMSNSR